MSESHAEVAAETGVYYDRLSRWTNAADVVGYGGGRDKLTVHRALADPARGGRPTVTRVHDLLFATVPALATGRVLDAGCGLGGTMLDFAARGRASFTGITLSETQARTGRRAADATGLTGRVRILVRSYDEPPAEIFDAVLAIESLAHSHDPAATVAALAARLAPGGSLAIVDDLPLPAARGTSDLTLFQTGWRLPKLLGADELRSACEAAGLTIVDDRDLSDEVRPRTLRRIAQLETLNRWARRCAPTAALRAMLDSYRGGLALERLYRHGLMRYGLVVARAP